MKILSLTLQKWSVASSFKSFFCRNGKQDPWKESGIVKAKEFNRRLHNLILSVTRDGPPEVRSRGGYLETTNSIEIIRVAVLHEMQVMEEFAREQRKNAADDSVVAAINEYM